MVSIYEEVEIEDMTFNDEDGTFYYPCPCGDKFSIELEELLDGEDIAHCPSCTLKIRIIYDDDYLAKFEKAKDGKSHHESSNEIPVGWG